MIRETTVLFVCLCLLAGCAPKVHKMYSGSSRAPSEIAVLLVRPPLQLNRIDGKKAKYIGAVYIEDSDRVEMLPGEHIFTVSYHLATGTDGVYQYYRQGKDMEITLIAIAGHTYRLECDLGDILMGIWNPYIRDETTGQIVAGRRVDITPLQEALIKALQKIKSEAQKSGMSQ